MTLVKISAKSARLLFTECGPLCIEHNGCKGNCCDAPSRPTGCMVTVHDSERARLELYGVEVRDSFIQPAEGQRGCPFKRDGLCLLHGGPDKPFGCIASPFTLNANDTLVIRNRYKMLPCYRGSGPKEPAYRAFRSSLVAIFGEDQTRMICWRLDTGGDDFSANTLPGAYAMLKENDAAKRKEANRA